MLDSAQGFTPRYNFQTYLGTGSFGTVYKAHDVHSHKTVAIKRVKKLQNLTSREHKVLQQAQNSPNVIQCLDIFYTYNSTSLIQNLVFEYMPMNLCRYIREVYSKGRISTKDIICIMRQILQALSFLKTKEIMHRDLKPENILFDPLNKKVKLCDLGSAKKVTDGENTPFIVSRYYRAPELIFGNENYSFEIDIWAAGCVFLELFTGAPVFKGSTDGNQFIEQVYVLGPPTPFEYSKFIEKTNIPAKLIGKIMKIERKKSIKEMLSGRDKAEEAEGLAKLMLSYDPLARPTADQCLAHPFFKL